MDVRELTRHLPFTFHASDLANPSPYSDVPVPRPLPSPTPAMMRGIAIHEYIQDLLDGFHNEYRISVGVPITYEHIPRDHFSIYGSIDLIGDYIVELKTTQFLRQEYLEKYLIQCGIYRTIVSALEKKDKPAFVAVINVSSEPMRITEYECRPVDITSFRQLALERDRLVGQSGGFENFIRRKFTNYPEVVDVALNFRDDVQLIETVDLSYYQSLSKPELWKKLNGIYMKDVLSHFFKTEVKKIDDDHFLVGNKLFTLSQWSFNSTLF